ncbi:MAG: succinylglutamate desuccinylase/aspartoacylase family protein [Pseudomonadota bacterium]
MRRSPIITEIGDGKSVHTHTVFGLDNRGQYVFSDIPVVRVEGRAGQGPNIMFTGAIHGDEYEGPATLARLAREIDPHELAGNLIIVPQVNPTAVRNRSRRSPLDNRDLNRSFPGDENGDLTEAIAHFVSTKLLPEVEAVFDLHAGGEDSFYSPSTLGHFIQDEEIKSKTIAAMKAFSAPVSLLLDEEQADTMFDAQVEQSGKVFFTAELGGTACLTVETLAIAWRGVNNILCHYNMWDRPVIEFTRWKDWDAPKFLSSPDHRAHPVAPKEGFFTPSVETGQYVQKGQEIGNILSMVDPMAAPISVAATSEGWVYARHSGGFVAEGYDLAIIGQEIDP